MTDNLIQFAPKYRQIANTLRRQIREGLYQPKHNFPTEAKLVDEFSVSRATVRGALNLLVQERLLERQQGRGTFVAELHSQKRSTTLVFSYPNVSSLQHPYIGTLYHSFEEGVGEFIKETGKEISVQCVRQAKKGNHFTLLHAEDALQAQLLDSQHVQGLCLTTTVPEEEILEIQKLGIWCVTFGGSRTSPVPCVYENRLSPVRLALAHLKALGHRRVGFVKVDQPDSPSELEFREQSAALAREMGLDVREVYDVTCPDYRRETGYTGVLELLKGAPRPTALYCYDDFLALGARDAALELGIAVPGQLSIVGLGNYFPDSGLTTIQTANRAMGRAAAQILTGLVFETYDGPFQVQVEGHDIMVRESTGPVPKA